jgi:hypothetical protein
VRVEGTGDEDESGVLHAASIKVLPPAPVIKLIGPLDALSSSSLTVDGILVNRTSATQVINESELQVGDRVGVRASGGTSGELLALQVVEVSPVPDDPDDDGEEDPNKTTLIGVIDRLPENGMAGTWIVSGIPVQVGEETNVHTRVGVLAPGAWVKIQGQIPEGSALLWFVAERVKTTHTHKFHKLFGELDDLNEIEVKVDDIVIARSLTSAVRGDPQPGGRVVVKMLPTLPVNDEAITNVEAVLIEARGQQQGPPSEPGLVVKFTGRVDALPVDAEGQETLYGQWTIAGHAPSRFRRARLSTSTRDR